MCLNSYICINKMKIIDGDIIIVVRSNEIGWRYFFQTNSSIHANKKKLKFFYWICFHRFRMSSYSDSTFQSFWSNVVHFVVHHNRRHHTATTATIKPMSSPRKRFVCCFIFCQPRIRNETNASWWIKNGHHTLNSWSVALFAVCNCYQFQRLHCMYKQGQSLNDII